MKLPFIVMIDGQTVFRADAEVDLLDPASDRKPEHAFDISFDLHGQAVTGLLPFGILLDRQARHMAERQGARLGIHFGCTRTYPLSIDRGEHITEIMADFGRGFVGIDNQPISRIIDEEQWGFVDLHAETAD